MDAAAWMALAARSSEAPTSLSLGLGLGVFRVSGLGFGFRVQGLRGVVVGVCPWPLRFT